MKFRVDHDVVGPFKKGQIITGEHLGESTDIGRLVRIKAISPVGDEATPIGEPESGPLYGPNAPFGPTNPHGFTTRLPQALERVPVTTLPQPIHEQIKNEVAAGDDSTASSGTVA
jgi:hypothetical protein